MRGCPRLEALCLGGCVQLSNISLQLVADHTRPRLRRLGLGGLASLTDIDLEDVGKCGALEWLELRACAKLSDSGVKQLGLLAARQCKALDAWEAAGGGDARPRALTELDLGGLVRLSDAALGKLTQRTRWLIALDLRGCRGLTAAGVLAALAPPRLPQLRRLNLTAVETVPERLRQLRPAVELVL